MLNLVVLSDPQYLMDVLKAAGYGCVINSWVDCDQVAVAVYKEGCMVGNGEGVLLADALRHAAIQLGLVASES